MSIGRARHTSNKKGFCLPKRNASASSLAKCVWPRTHSDKTNKLQLMLCAQIIGLLNINDLLVCLLERSDRFLKRDLLA